MKQTKSSQKKQTKQKSKVSRQNLQQPKKTSPNTIIDFMKSLFSTNKKEITAQQTIPYKEMYKDGVCKVTDKSYSKSIEFFDVNYQLSKEEDQKLIFGNYCNFINSFDSSIDFQLSFINQYGDVDKLEKAVVIKHQNDNFNNIRSEYSAMLKNQLEKGNNGLIKKNYITFTIESENLKKARFKLERIGLDIINNFKLMGVSSKALNGTERLRVLCKTMNYEKGKFKFNYDIITQTGNGTKDFIAPTSFDFSQTKTFKIGNMYGAANFLQINAQILYDRFLAEILEMEEIVFVTIHVKLVEQSKAIKHIKSKLSDIDSMRINEQKKAVDGNYGFENLPPELNSYKTEATKLLDDLAARSERLFIASFIFVNISDELQKLENAVEQLKTIALRNSCEIRSLDFQQEDAFVSTLPLGLNRLQIDRALTTSSIGIFIPFTTQELFQVGNDVLYYGRNVLSGNMIMVDRKRLKNPKGLYCKGRSKDWKTQASVLFAAQTDGQPEKHGNRNILLQLMTYSNAGKFFQKLCEKSSELPPLSDLYMREYRSPKYTTERSAASIFYTTQSKNSISERSQFYADNYQQCG